MRLGSERVAGMAVRRVAEGMHARLRNVDRSEHRGPRIKKGSSKQRHTTCRISPHTAKYVIKHRLPNGRERERDVWSTGEEAGYCGW